MPNPPIDMNEFVGRTNTFVHGYAGATVNAHTMKPHNLHDPGFIVAEHTRHTGTKYGPYTEKKGNNLRSRMLADPAVKADPHATMGTWTRGPEGAESREKTSTVTDRGVHVNTGDHVADMEKSVLMGHRNKQDAVFNLRDPGDIATKTHADLQHARIHATVHPERTSAFTKPNPLFGE